MLCIGLPVRYWFSGETGRLRSNQREQATAASLIPLQNEFIEGDPLYSLAQNIGGVTPQAPEIAPLADSKALKFRS